MNFGKRVEVERKARGWKQSAVAEMAKLDQSRISRIEAGEADPRLSEMVRIAAAFEVPLADFVCQDRGQCAA